MITSFYIKMIALLLLSWFLNWNIVTGNVIGLDFGSDSMKVALVQPGSPLEIVNNFQSKRKTPNSISFYRGERMFGSDSIALMARKPELTFSKAYRVLGRTVDNPLSKELVSQYFPHEIYANETTGFTCFKQEETFYTPEELVAMMMQHARDMTINFGGKNIKDCVITVPSHFTHHERRALYTAAQIADLRVLTLMEENTAAALHYSMDRVFETPSTVLFFNMGASSVQVTIATFSSYTAKELGKNKTTSQFEVIGKGWDRSLGGFNFDVKLAELMATRFNEVWGKKKSGKGKDLRDFVRPMTRLRVEALKVKEVLSANNEYPVKLEQLHDDTDLVTKITRVDFEEACADLFDRVLEPINQALSFANISVSDINSVELLGGSVRIPRVKKLLDDFFKPSKIELGQHLNGDEAMALGAAFRGANLSTSFKVRKVGQSDINNFGISIHLEALPSADQKSGLFGFFGGKKDSKVDVTGDDAWTKDAEVFPKKLTLSSKLRTVSFPFDKDIVCKIAYTDPGSLPIGTDPTIAVLNITGVTEFSKEVAKKASSSPKVHLSFVLDSDGVVTLVKAEATSELPVVETLDNDTNVTADITTDANSTDGNETTEESGEDVNSTATDTKKSKADKKSSKKEKKAKKDNTLRRSLAVSENRLATQPPLWDDANILESKSKLHSLNLADDARKAKEAALNELEGYIYKVKNRFADEEVELGKVSTTEQREEVLTLARQAEEWLEEANSLTTTVKEYNDKFKGINTMAEPIFYRYSELTSRPTAIKKLQTVLTQLREKIGTWTEKLPQITEKETESMLESIQKVDSWIEKKTGEQEAKPSHEEPAFESSEVLLQIKPVQALFEKLIRKPKPPPEKIKVNVTNASSNSTTEDKDGNETVVIDGSSNQTDTSAETSADSESENATTEEEKSKDEL